MFEHGYLTVALPKFNVMAVYKLLSPLLGCVIVLTFQRNRFLEMAVMADKVDAIIRHGTAPIDQAGALTNSQSPMVAEIWR
jgi:hypothetical protein